jgi:phospholipid/cholesterol/gamma-HCH transport system substrate-binding protein
MSPRHATGHPHRAAWWRPYVIAAAMAIGLVLLTFFTFNPKVPFTSGYRVDAVFSSSSGLRKGSPVRIAGVDAGKVVGLSDGPGDTTRVTMEIEEGGRPVHRDATAKIRPRVFLEGGFLIELKPGSPSAPEVPDDGTIPLPQTAVPVQFHNLLSTFDAPARDSFRTMLDGFARGLDGGGAQGLKTLAPELRPLLRDTAWVAQAMRGREGDDLSATVASMSRITRALDRDPGRLGDMVGNLATTAQAFHARDRELAATISEASGTVGSAPRAMRSVDATLPVVERSVRQLTPAMEVAPRAFRRATATIRELGGLVAPSRRTKTLAALETSLRDLPIAVQRLTELFPAVKPLTDCLSSHVVPTFSAVVPDGDHTTGDPVWQDFAHYLVGLSSASQGFDGNGYHQRYQFGIDGSTVSTERLPGVGSLVGRAPSNLRSRPVPRPDRKPPPQQPDVDCRTQPVPKLATPDGPAGLNPQRTGSGGKPIPLTMDNLRRILSDENVKRSLKGLEK